MAKRNNIEKRVENKVREVAKKRPILFIVAVILIIALVIVGYFVYKKYFKKPIDDTLSIHFLELGSYYTGDSTLIKTGDIEILIDAGSKQSSIETIDNYIGRYCTDNKLEYVIVTHAHEDHYACFTTENSLFNRYEIGTIIDFSMTNQEKKGLYKNYLRERQEAIDSGAVHYTAKECRENNNYIFNITDDITLTVLDSYYYYNTDSSDENNYSVCTLLTQGDRNFLFTGDLESKGEKKLVELNDLPKVELFKAGHHGSYTSSNDCLLSVIRPKRVCVCCCAGSSKYRVKEEGNKFPTQDFIDRVAPYTKEVYVTTLCVSDDEKTFKSLNGNIVVTSSVDGVSVNCSNNNILLKDTDWFKEKRICPEAWIS